MACDRIPIERHVDGRTGLAHAIAVDERNTVFEEGFDQGRRQWRPADEDCLERLQCRRIPAGGAAQRGRHLGHCEVMRDAEVGITKDCKRPVGQEAVGDHQPPAHHQRGAPDGDKADGMEEGQVAERH